MDEGKIRDSKLTDRFDWNSRDGVTFDANSDWVFVESAIRDQVYGSEFRNEVLERLARLQECTVELKREVHAGEMLDEEREAEIARLVESAREGWQAHADEEARANVLEEALREIDLLVAERHPERFRAIARRALASFEKTPGADDVRERRGR